ncbi:MAG: PTS sugar transporter subunit IIC [Lachnospiraceae bacterium]|nr:PTS sugar transporter subunit IIC [Lachnospiraceae bacterium]
MFTIPQIVLVIVWFTAYNWLTTATGLSLTAGGVVFNGLVVGAIMGDISTGFYLGGTYELMNIGLNPLGGSTVPNYNMGVVVGVAFGAVTSLETGMAVGIVVATLASTLDVLAKMCGSFFLHKAQNLLDKKDIKGALRWIDIGLWPRILLDATIPLLILFIFGSPVVELINNVIPAWLLSGFKNAGNMLPAIGFAILLRSMNLKGNFQYVIIGFVLYAYLGIGALGAALVGIALAMIAYYNNQKIADIQVMGGVDDE